MADQDSNSKKVHISLSSVIDACKKCVDYAERLAVLIDENKQLANQNTSLVILLDQEKEINAKNYFRENHLKTKLKAAEKDLKALNLVVRDKIAYLDQAHIAVTK